MVDGSASVVLQTCVLYKGLCVVHGDAPGQWETYSTLCTVHDDTTQVGGFLLSYHHDLCSLAEEIPDGTT